ncbi:MAG: 2-C-methyl-D-erythritol 4-phosphate cytidylyltransferase [Planctomycetes bacterium]|nr:2-C-methyl-D-erythritol 4-phosphate cytidylyltransferase [Planctomycetota bacterium]
MPRDLVCLCPAAGLGTRLPGRKRKTWRLLGGIPILDRTLSLLAAAPGSIGTLLAVHPEEVDRLRRRKAWLRRHRILAVVAGGAHRQASVREALRRVPAVAPQARWVLVHDGVRPLVTRQAIRGVIRAARTSHGAGGATLALPVAETVKRSRGGAGAPLVLKTVPRDGLWTIQTPQVFPRALLERAYRRAGSRISKATDDCQIAEWAGGRIWLVIGPRWNLKITTPQDLRIASAFTS